MINEARFWRHVQVLEDKCDACWIWIGAMRDDGRGRFWDGSRRKVILAHWAAWEVQNGSPVPQGYRLVQVCDEPQCVRHWKLGGKVRKLTPAALREIAKGTLGPKALSIKYAISLSWANACRKRLCTERTPHNSPGGTASFA